MKCAHVSLRTEGHAQLATSIKPNPRKFHQPRELLLAVIAFLLPLSMVHAHASETVTRNDDGESESSKDFQ